MTYTGPYLKQTSPRGKDPIKFRNHIHHQLLRYHFKNYPPDTNTQIDIAFDFYRMSKADFDNLESYLRKVCMLPGINHICHIDSRFCFPLQLTSQLVNLVSDIPQGKANQQNVQLLDFISLKDVTKNNWP